MVSAVTTGFFTKYKTHLYDFLKINQVICIESYVVPKKITLNSNIKILKRK